MRFLLPILLLLAAPAFSEEIHGLGVVTTEAGVSYHAAILLSTNVDESGSRGYVITITPEHKVEMDSVLGIYHGDCYVMAYANGAIAFRIERLGWVYVIPSDPMIRRSIIESKPSPIRQRMMIGQFSQIEGTLSTFLVPRDPRFF